MNNSKKSEPDAMPEETPDDRGEGSPEAEDAEQRPDAPHAAPAAEDPLSTAEREREELRELYQRALAELENARKRHQREMAEQRQYSVSELARDLLEVLDNLQRALAGLGPEHENDPLAAGVRLVEEQLVKTLRNHGVRPIAALGQPFDPMRHQAVLQEETDQAAPGTITEELVRGYHLADRLLRPTTVKVAKLPAGTKESAADEPIEE
jgi:molecular chaperone GrpE